MIQAGIRDPRFEMLRFDLKDMEMAIGPLTRCTRGGVH